MDTKIGKLAPVGLFTGCPAMDEEPTTTVIQRYLDALPGDTAAEPIVRELLERAVGRLRLLCATLLYKSYPRLTRPPVNLESDELLGRYACYLINSHDHPVAVGSFLPNAFGLFDMAVKLHPVDQDILINLWHCAQALGREGEVLPRMRYSLAKDPSQSDLKAAVGL